MSEDALIGALEDCLTMMARHTWLKRDAEKHRNAATVLHAAKQERAALQEAKRKPVPYPKSEPNLESAHVHPEGAGPHPLSITHTALALTDVPAQNTREPVLPREPDGERLKALNECWVICRQHSEVYRYKNNAAMDAADHCAIGIHCLIDAACKPVGPG